MWSRLSLMLMGLLPTLISVSETLHGNGDGAKKAAAVKTLTLAIVQATEGIAARDILNDAEVSNAFDAIVNAIVAFHNIVAKKAPPTTPA